MNKQGIQHPNAQQGQFVQVLSQTHSGPLPLPEILQGYENIAPGFADRIITMAEKQAQHRQDIEKIAYKSEARNSLLGIVVAGAVVTLISAVGFLSGSALGGSLLGGTGLVGLAGAFIYGTRTQQRNQNGDQKVSEQSSKQK
jgi:uncharacterized membrane protein